MQMLVSVKNPTRGGLIGARAGFVDGAGTAPVGLDERSQSRPARAAARTDVAGQRLVLGDVDVEVEHHGDQLVGRVAGDQAAAAPVVWKADDVGRPSLHGQRPDPIGHQHARLDRGAVGHDGRPAGVLEAALGPPARADTSQNASGWSSDRYGTVPRHAAGRVVLGQPEVVRTKGKDVGHAGLYGFSGRSKRCRVGLERRA